MKHSAPNTWRYGGIIEAVTWDLEESGVVRLRNGEVHEAHPGDVVHVFRTGEPYVTFVGIEHRGAACEA